MSIQGECRNGVAVCLQGYVPFDSCCGYGSGCNPYPGPSKLWCEQPSGDAGRG